MYKFILWTIVDPWLTCFEVLWFLDLKEKKQYSAQIGEGCVNRKRKITSFLMPMKHLKSLIQEEVSLKSRNMDSILPVVKEFHNWNSPWGTQVPPLVMTALAMTVGIWLRYETRPPTDRPIVFIHHHLCLETHTLVSSGYAVLLPVLASSPTGLKPVLLIFLCPKIDIVSGDQALPIPPAPHQIAVRHNLDPVMIPLLVALASLAFQSLSGPHWESKGSSQLYYRFTKGVRLWPQLPYKSGKH